MVTESITSLSEALLLYFGVKVTQSGKEVDSWYGGYFKERSKLEAEYARGLRRLVRNYTVKEKNRRDEEETSQARGFRCVLSEI